MYELDLLSDLLEKLQNPTEKLQKTTYYYSILVFFLQVAKEIKQRIQRFQ